ncbi:uncharacterized protein I303_101962 [Kwoniella dejecticola CBS 10117]|uniref:Alpha 1,2-mannosyltransferase n=1 Tax=Kwoniella dejecticola CBS 10117 TaxID=1296121 RepID=A0A1A6ACC7_9TREE|nr:uncharacterized protein I303_01902 [Kwoniella dejecticola CBS 10117]OBR87693.1 hypothetical protein I303_01902 [Kwoniella dejecticola CBS 10117]
MPSPNAPKPKLHIPITEKSSPFFSKPYNPSRSQLSPIPDNSPVSGFQQSSSTSESQPSSSDGGLDVDCQTPLLPSPGRLENGHGHGHGHIDRSYPFPSDWRNSNHNSALLTRLKMLLRKGPHPHNVLVKRVVVLLFVLGLAVLGLHTQSNSMSLSSSKGDFDSSRDPLANPAAANTEKPKRPFKYPFQLSTPSGVKHKTIYSDAHAQGKRTIDIASEPLPITASLRERLDAWREAPGGRGEVEGEVEHGGFVQWNLEQCDTISEQHNTHMIQHSANLWASVNRTSLHQYRTELIDHMEGVLDRGEHEGYGEGRGIVMVAGNADTLQRVKWSLQMLRSYGSELPVQIYHFPSEKPKEDDPIVNDLKELNAELVEAAGQQRDAKKNKSYHLKALAVVQSPFREVLYLDSDSIPTRDPAYMFDAPNYKRLGIWATPDYWKTSANNPIWSIIGVKCRNEWEMETGQMFIDKSLHLDTFLLIKYMLERHEFWFYFSDGDKDIFRWAMLALRKRWAVPGRWVGAAALPSGTASGDFCSHTMLQHDSWGEPLFVHYNLLKQIPSGVGRGFSWGRTKQMPLFNTWPATPATARLNEPETKPSDDILPGLGDVDCDMLADAQEDGTARAPAKEMIMRRAARERGIKVKYHGGWISALCIDLDYIDPRPEDRKEADAERKKIMEEQAALSPVPDEPASAPKEDADEEDKEFVGVIYPDWEQSPIEVVQWRDDEHLKDFESKIYDLGFKPSGPGF